MRLARHPSLTAIEFRDTTGDNAAPNRIQRLRKQAGKEGLDPNIWFRNVELVVAREVSREPVVYVANIFKYYIAYSMVLELESEKANERKP